MLRTYIQTDTLVPVWHVADHGGDGVTTSSRVKLGWEVPDDRWAEYTAKVEEEWGESRLYAGVQIEKSWREYRDVHPLEDHANRLLEAAGLPRETDKNKNPTKIPSLANTESNRQFVRVHEDVKQEMEQYATANSLPKHEVLRGVIAWYLGGSREERLVEKFDRVVPEAENAFVEATDDGPNTADGLSKSERVTRKIARFLGDSFSENNLEDAINAETTGTDYYHDEYMSRVVEYKGVKRWERNDAPDLFFPLETWRTKKMIEIVSALGGGYETSPPAFSPEELVKAVERAGIEECSENRKKTINRYKDRIVERFGFAWSDETEKFEPMDILDAETESNSNAGVADDVVVSDIGGGDASGDADSGSTTVTDRLDDLAAGTPVRADGGDNGGMTHRDSGMDN